MLASSPTMSASGTDHTSGTSAKMSRPSPGPTEWIKVSVVYGPHEVEKKRTKTSPSVPIARGSFCTFIQLAVRKAGNEEDQPLFVSRNLPDENITMMSVHDKRRRSAYVIALCCVAAIGGFLFGFDSGVINGTVDALAKAFGTDAAGTGFAVASVLLGCAAGAFGAGRLADSLGRRPTMLLNAILFLASAVATGAANSATFFIASRLAGGLAIGAASVLAPMYIAEVAPAHIRGRLASLQQMAIVLGLFGAFLSNDVLVRLAGGARATLWLGAPAWRWMFWMEAVPSIAFLAGVLMIPESPRFLVAR